MCSGSRLTTAGVSGRSRSNRTEWKAMRVDRS